MGYRCINAARDLPPEVFTVLSAALGRRAGFIWVPSPRSSSRGRRDAYVVRLFEEGHTAASIGAQLCISERTVRRILARERGGGLPSERQAGQR